MTHIISPIHWFYIIIFSYTFFFFLVYSILLYFIPFRSILFHTHMLGFLEAISIWHFLFKFIMEVKEVKLSSICSFNLTPQQFIKINCIKHKPPVHIHLIQYSFTLLTLLTYHCQIWDFDKYNLWICILCSWYIIWIWLKYGQVIFIHLSRNRRNEICVWKKRLTVSSITKSSESKIRNQIILKWTALQTTRRNIILDPRERECCLSF